MASQKVTIFKADKITKTLKISMESKQKQAKEEAKKGRHKTTDCCVHEYHNK